MTGSIGHRLVNKSKQATQRLWTFFGNKEWQRLLYVVFATAGLSSILVAGPFLQQVITSLLLSDQASLYSGVYQGVIAPFLTAGQWFYGAMELKYLSCAALIVIVASLSPNVGTFLIRVTFAAATGLSAIDLLSTEWSQAGAAEELVISAVCNVAGGFLIASTLLVIFAESNIARHLRGSNSGAERAVRIVWPLLCGLAISACLFFAFKLLLNVPSTPVIIHAGPPVSAWFANEDIDGCSANTAETKAQPSCTTSNPSNSARPNHKSGRRKESFGVLAAAPSDVSGKLEWTGSSKSMELSLVKLSQEPISASVQLFEGCIDREALEKKLSSDPKALGIDIRSLNIKIDDGISMLRIVGPGRPGAMEMIDDNVSQFSIYKSKSDPEKFDVTRLVSNASLKFESQFDSANYEIGIMPFASDDTENIAPIQRTIVVTTNGKAQKFLIRTTPHLRLKQKPECKLLALETDKDAIVATAGQPYVSVVVSLAPPTTVRYASFSTPDLITIEGLSGWVTLNELIATDIEKVVTPGNVATVTVTGALKEILLGGEEFKSRDADSIQLTGKLRGAGDGKSLTFRGDGAAVYLNGQRVNKTRWEQLDIGLRISLFLGLPTAFIYFCNLFLRVARRKGPILDWT